MLSNALILAIASLGAAKSILGVPPQMESLYKPDSNGNWHCILDPSHVIRFDQINDNFCDCPDGSDEPGTNACEFTFESPKMFYCANEGFLPNFIENYKLNDGVCDYEICCDGLDEYLSGKCPDVCPQVKRQYDDYVRTQKEEIAKGLLAKKLLEERAAELRAASERSMSELATKIEDIKRTGSESALVESESHKSDQDETLLVIEEGKLNELSQLYVDKNTELSSKLKLLETIMLDMSKNYNPNFNDAAVKSAIGSFQNYYSNKAELELPLPDLKEIAAQRLSLFSEYHQNGFLNLLTSNIYSLPGMVHLYFNQFVDSFPQHSTKEPTYENENKIAKNDHKVSEELQFLLRDLAALELENKKNYGENDVLRALVEQPYEKKIGEYTYKIDFMNSIYQDRTLVGRYTGFEDGSMEFAWGDRCWNGPQRSATVNLICAAEFDLLSVDEPQKCHYQFVLTSPVACKELSEEELAKGFKLNKAQLF